MSLDLFSLEDEKLPGGTFWLHMLAAFVTSIDNEE